MPRHPQGIETRLAVAHWANAQLGAGVDTLLDFAAPVDAGNVLVVGRGAVDVACALIRHGCISAATQHLDDRAERADTDLLIVPEIATIEEAERALHLARHALVPTGRAVLRTVAGKPAALSIAIVRLIRGQGLVRIRSQVAGGQAMLGAEIPAFDFGPAELRRAGGRA